MSYYVVSTPTYPMKNILFVLMIAASTIHMYAQTQRVYCSEIDDMIKDKGVFPFGIASGDPTQNSVVLWTAINPYRTSSTLQLECELSENILFSDSTVKFIRFIRYEDGFTGKINAENLKPGKTYYYRFIYSQDTSVVGITKTLGENPENLKFAVASCSNFEWGYFNAYGSLAKIKELDFVIHLGDYIYEYGPGTYGNKDLARKHIPQKEIISMTDYRSRYAQYRLDPNLQELHRVVPFITVWDDHEIANDSYVEGAQNHQDDEGSWDARKENGKKAYFEWMPITDNTMHSIRRKFKMGNLAELYMLDGRMEGRSQQLKSFNDTDRTDSTRSMLGAEQRDWLQYGVSHSTAKWKIIGNQVVFSSYNYPKQMAKYEKSMDMWEGYPIERDQILSKWLKDEEKNIIILTGDVHASFSIDLRKDIHDPKTHVGTEWVAPSITSSSLDEYIPTWKARLAEKFMAKRKTNPQINYLNFRDHGFLLVELNNEKASAQWWYEKNILKPKAKIKKKASRSVRNIAPVSTQSK